MRGDPFKQTANAERKKKQGIGSVINGKLIPYEDEEQIIVAQWLVWNGIRFHHAQNEGDHKVQYRKKQHALGVFPGFPDLFIPETPPLAPRYKGCFIEMKRQVGGTVSADQEEWMELLEDLGYKTAVCKGAKEAIPLLRTLGYNIKERQGANSMEWSYIYGIPRWQDDSKDTSVSVDDLFRIAGSEGGEMMEYKGKMYRKLDVKG